MITNASTAQRDKVRGLKVDGYRVDGRYGDSVAMIKTDRFGRPTATVLVRPSGSGLYWAR